MKVRKIIASAAAVAALGMASAPVLASTDTEVHSGMVDLDENNPLLKSSGTQECSGGIWKYGVGTKYVWSYYQHKTKSHKSSVKPGRGKMIVSSGKIKPGTQSKASAPKSIFGGNEAYYHVY